MDYSKMTKEQIRAELDRLMKENESLKSKGSRKKEVLSLLRKGMNNIEEIAGKVGIKEKNVSSILSYLRKDLSSKGEGILSVKYDNKNFVVLMKLSEINELLSLDNFGKLNEMELSK